jgi:hypothetical protein
MNLLCPHCQKPIAIADQYAGQLMKCPLCGSTFTAPVLPAATPPSVASEPVRSDPEGTSRSVAGAGPARPALADYPPPVSAAAGYRRTATVHISPRVVPWVGPAGLIVGFGLSFFAWLIYVAPADENGGPITAASAWGLAFSRPVNGLSILFLLFLSGALLLSAAGLILPRIPTSLPGAVRAILPLRAAIALALVTMACAFLVLQLTLGFEQEHQHSAALPLFTARTNWLRASALVLLVAVAGYALEFWLTVRKAKPPPRLEISW